MNNEKKLIDDIKNEYLSEKNKKQTVINSMWSQYQKMGKELSEGIYAEDNHFIYELIQNAEDTKSNEKQHTLEFTLENDGLIIFNNEVGFTEDQIKAICSFGESTKALEKNEGFIGEKGIGFKSVFKITDKPAIFSNGYRFYFNRLDETGTTTEYIIPHWINDNELKKYPLEFQNNTHTTLYLPFSKEKNQEKIDKLKEDIKHIEPILLLFLKKLTNIKINESSQKVINTRKTSKKDEQLELVTIQNKNTLARYYLFKKSINVNQNLDEVKDKNGRRKGIKKREIILAFPNFENEIQEDRIFSFLPTKLHSELNFIIQADFILQSGRENIAIDNEWNQWQFDEIEKLIGDEIVNKLQKHSKLKFRYLDYFLKNGNSHNELIEKLYKSIIDNLKNNCTILANNETWQKPNNIILLEDNIRIDTKYLKLLFSENYEQVHQKFNLNEYFINTFNIKRVNKEKLLNQIFIYLDKYNELNIYNPDDVFYLTKIISKYLNFGRDGRKFDEDYLKKIKISLPIIPKYKTNKKFYLYDTIYISSEYKPKFSIENITQKNEFDFTKYNFLSDDYLEDKRLIDFIKNIIDEQEKHKNKKTIDFFTKYPNILQNYLKKDIKRNYKKIFDYLIEIQEDNKDKISKISLLLTQNDNFYNSTQIVYFSNDSDSDLEVLDKNLFDLVNKEHQYKEFLEQIFKVKEADILNIILNEYLPWIKKSYQSRTLENDKNLLKYTKEIIENFDKFEKEDKYKIKQSLFFISSNQKNRYLKSSSIYLSQNLTEIIFDTNSIEKYITDKSYFDFLDKNYNSFINTIDEEKVIDFFRYFSFEKYIKEEDISNFIKFIKQDLNLDLNLEALEFISKSIDIEDRKKTKDIENFKVYSQNDNLIEIKNIFQNKINDLEIDCLHKEYKKKISELHLKNIKQYFQSELKIKPFISYLKKNITFNEAIKVYLYLDRKSDSFSGMIDKIRKFFKGNKLIYQKDGKKFYPTDVTWKEEKSANQLFALSIIYPSELENFFIKKIQVSQTKDIRQIINQIKSIKKKSNDYFDLLIDLNDLIGNRMEIYKYYNSFKNKFPIDNDEDEDTKKFILEKEQIFILDNGKKNTNNNFYFNDLEIDNYDEKLKNKIFTVNNRYPIGHYDNLVNNLKIKRLSKLEKDYANRKFVKNYDIKDYRLMLNFAYDLLFTKFFDEYKKLENRESNLKELNEVNIINIHQDIVSQIMFDDVRIELDGVKYYFRENELFIINENDLFIIISEKLGAISDKDIKDFYNEVVNANQPKEQYYKDENIKEKQNFILDISDEIIKDNKIDVPKENYFNIDVDSQNSEENTERNNSQNNEKTAEEKRNERQKSGAEQVRGYNRNISNNENETLPLNLKDTKEYQKKYREEKIKKQQRILKKSHNVSKKTIEKLSQQTVKSYKIGEEETKDFFRKKDQYLGQCQICGFTFTTKNGVNYCERFTWSDYTRIKVKADLIDAGNSLCLCAKCHSIIKGGGDFEATFLKNKVFEMLKSSNNDYDFDTFIEDIDSDKLINPPDCFKEHIEFNDMYFVDIRLNNNDKERIYFTEEHLVMFFEFLKS